MKKRNPTLERTYEMLLADRKLRSKVFKLPGHFGGILSKRRAKVLAKKVYEKGLHDERKEQ